MDRTATARAIMFEFADLTDLRGEGRRRYLWTDAFAVCNLLELHRLAEDPGLLDLALRLVDRVHAVLGQHRADDPRTGWLSGLGGKEAERHPTRGGLRIGKPLGERPADADSDPRDEWDRDGQYFHYLTKWMHALARVARVTGEPRYHRWAVELAEQAHHAFSWYPQPGRPPRLHWKMSIDLTRAQVAAMGQHDPLDAAVTYRELQATAPEPAAASVLARAVDEADAICRAMEFATDDPLGLGGLLADACRLGELVVDHGRTDDVPLLERVLDAADAGLAVFAAGRSLALPAEQRLAFRELGLAIGLRGLDRLRETLARPEAPAGAGALAARVEDLRRARPLADEIEIFWLEPRHREAATWTDHREINMVMLATTLTPDGFLAI
jgi:hypothetical protein